MANVLRAALVLVLLALCLGPVRAQELLTVENFPTRFATHPVVKGVEFSPFHCQLDRKDATAVVCFNQVKFHRVSAAIMLKGNAASRELTYADVAVGNPALSSDARAALSVLYMVLTVGLVSTLSPDFKGAVSLVTELQENVHRKPYQIRVAPWLYGASAGPMLVFTAMRK